MLLVEDRGTVIQLADDKSNLITRIPKIITRRQKDMSIERIFSKKITFKKRRQIRNPAYLNSPYSLTNPIKFKTYKMAFDVYEHILFANSNDEKVSNYKLSKAVGLKIGSRTTDKAQGKATIN